MVNGTLCELQNIKFSADENVMDIDGGDENGKALRCYSKWWWAKHAVLNDEVRFNNDLLFGLLGVNKFNNHAELI